jgi:hypothetical protein
VDRGCLWTAPAPRRPALYGGPVRWDALFADLEAQLDREREAEQDAEVAERSRAEWARTALADRLRAHEGAELGLLLAGGHRVAGTCVDVGAEWLVLAVGPAQALVPLHAVVAVSGLSRRVAPPPGVVLRRLGLGHALRALARDRAGVRLVTAGGDLTGTIDRVGADHLDLAEHPAGEARRAGAVRAVLAVPFAALRAVHSA